VPVLPIDSPQAHIQVWVQQATLRVACYLTALAGDRVLDQYGFLHQYIETAHTALPEPPALAALDATWSAAVAAAEQALPPDARLPLLHLRRAGLGDDHMLALALIGLVELDARFSTVYGALHPFPDELHITVGLLGDLLRFGSSAALPVWHVVRDLERRGLVTVHQADRPRAARALSIPAAVWDAATEAGADAALELPGARIAFDPGAALPSLSGLRGLLPADFLEQLGSLPEMARGRLIDGVIVRGLRGSGRTRALAAVAHALGRGVLHIACDDARHLPEVCRLAAPLCVLLDALPILDLQVPPGETVALPALAGYAGLVGVVLTREGRIAGHAAARHITLHLPAPYLAARARQWAASLNGAAGGAPTLVAHASRTYQLTLGAVERTADLAHTYAALGGRDHVDIADVQEAYRALNQQSLENLTRRMHTAVGWDGLIVSERTRAELQNLILRCRHRESVLARLGRGFGGTTRGVRALFTGPSGTGKTLAARIVAAALGLDLYRVDLSAVVSKYIGETERNLSQLFARAEEQDVVLLLDEGDSLLTSRTDVRNSTDRYANLETNYLLQRLEDYEGIILVTSNVADRIDSAFQRRMDVSIEFSAPDAGQRQQLWGLHLPEDHAVGAPFLRSLALRCHLTGGQIRNAALHATLLAQEAEAPVGEAFVIEGIVREYTKQGVAAPLSF
jgi:hypothetical protein